ncbi:MAG TPA: hypothetical protein VJV79_06355 [Polyangiaceae bacterium]|nr:hypothetical protein [Polyangiaceae bacterium]
MSTPFSDSSNYDDDKLRVVSLLRTKFDFSIRVNGQVLGNVPNIDLNVSAAGGDVVLGGHPWVDGPANFTGSIVEIVLASNLTFDQAHALEATLLKKYADAL